LFLSALLVIIRLGNFQVNIRIQLFILLIIAIIVISLLSSPSDNQTQSKQQSKAFHTCILPDKGKISVKTFVGLIEEDIYYLNQAEIFTYPDLFAVWFESQRNWSKFIKLLKQLKVPNYTLIANSVKQKFKTI
jgi:hypothetical protein